MRKMIISVGICVLVVLFFWGSALLRDHSLLGQKLIRLHVVANSDNGADQERKLRVRDAVTECLRQDLEKITDVEAAKQYIQEKLPYLQDVAEQTLRSLGCSDSVAVSLCRETFEKRVYDTFTLPAGVYHALRIVIGEGRGKNWWCVVFPDFCMGAASSGMEAAAAGAGFSDTLCNTLTGEAGYELRFGLLDAIGKLENILFVQ